MGAWICENNDLGGSWPAAAILYYLVWDLPIDFCSLGAGEAGAVKPSAASVISNVSTN